MNKKDELRNKFNEKCTLLGFWRLGVYTSALEVMPFFWALHPHVEIRESSYTILESLSALIDYVHTHFLVEIFNELDCSISSSMTFHCL